MLHLKFKDTTEYQAEDENGHKTAYLRVPGCGTCSHVVVCRLRDGFDKLALQIPIHSWVVDVFCKEYESQKA